MFGAGQNQNNTGTGGFSMPNTANTAGGGTGSGFNFSFGGAASGTPATATTGFGAINTSTPASGFNFGAPKTTASTSTAGFGMFGARTQSGTTGFSGFGATATSAPSALSNLLQSTQSGPAIGLATGPSTTPATSGFSLQTQTAPQTGFSLGSTPASGFSLGGSLSASTTSGLTLGAATTSTATGFSFGASTATTTTTAAGFNFATSTAPTSTSTSGFSLGGATSGTGTTGGFSLGGTVPKTSASLGRVGFPTVSTAGSTPSTITTGASTSAPGLSVGSSQKQMTFRQLEDTINKWTTELEDQEKYFLDQATQVNAWDRIVMENGDKIIRLNKDVEKVKLDQQKLDHELDFVHSQQKELEELLVPLEKTLDDLPPISYQQHADVEREHTYMLAESLDAQLKRMGQDLKEIIERLNSNNTKPDINDPVQQITKILNAHVVSLQWIDRNSANLQQRVEEISKQMEVEKREQERNFRLAYN